MKEILLDAVFPPRCVGCEAFGSWCCDNCLLAIECVTGTPCRGCGSLKREHECAVARSPLDGLVVVGFYHDPRLRALIHGLKYQNATSLLPTVAALLNRYKNERRDPWSWAGERALSLQAVVGSPSRVKARGFDQAELIREVVRQELVPWGESSSLVARRSSRAGTQAELEPGPLRAANVIDAFQFNGERESLPEAVLLVDDVFTTGSTMHEAAKTLKLAGVRRVYGFALAIGA